jgi:Uma2 family endonuclease
MIATAPINSANSNGAGLSPVNGIDVTDLWQMTVSEYHRLIKLGFFTPDDRVELLDGYLVRKMPQDDPHAVLVNILPDEFMKVIPEEWIVRAQLPVTLIRSEPEPDAVICPGPKRRYRAGHPTAKDIPLIVEVADTTVRRDRTIKLAIYARNRIPVYWIINLIDNQIEVYTEPKAGRNPTYRVRKDYPAGSKVPVVLHGKHLGDLDVDLLLT